MSSIYGLGQSTASTLRTTRTDKTEEKGKTEEAGRRPPPPPPQYDSCSISEDGISTMSHEEETLFDYKDGVDCEALGIEEEDLDYSEMEAFEGIDYVSEEELDGDLEIDGDEDLEIDGDEDLEIDGDEDLEIDGDEDLEVDTDTEVEAVEVDRVHGYVSSISESDWEMLQIAYQANQMLVWEGSSLFDYMDSDGSTAWFDTDWNSGASTSSSYDWDSLFDSLFSSSSTDSTDDVEETDEVEEVEEAADTQVEETDTTVDGEISAEEIYADAQEESATA